MKNFRKLSYLLFIVVVMFVLVNPVLAEDISCPFISSNLKIDTKITDTVSIIILAIEVVVPILLVIFGSIDFVKALTSQKDDEIKKGQQTFIKRLIAAAIMFFVIAIVKLVVSLAAGKDADNIINCADCFLNGSDSDKCLTAQGYTTDTEDDSKTDIKVKTDN